MTNKKEIDKSVPVKGELDYQGYYCTARFNPDTNKYFGKIAYIPKEVAFEADNMKDLKIAFKNAVIEYLKTV